MVDEALNSDLQCTTCGM